MRRKSSVEGKLERDISPELCANLSLSEREEQVLLFLLSEMAPLQIASSLGITMKTVSNHKRSAMKKIGVRSTFQLHKWLVQHFSTAYPESYREL